MNTTSSSQTATIGLLCLGDRTSADGSATTIVNSATVTGAQPDLNAANDTAVGRDRGVASRASPRRAAPEAPGMRATPGAHA